MTRFGALAAALALLFSGIAVGAFGTFLVLERTGPAGPRSPAGPPDWGAPGHFPRGPRGDGPPGPPPPPVFSREMSERLGLSEEQKMKIDGILAEGREQGEALRRELRPRFEAQIEGVRARIAEVLTPDQRTRFDAMVREDRARAERFFLRPPGGPRAGGPPPVNRP